MKNCDPAVSTLVEIMKNGKEDLEVHPKYWRRRVASAISGHDGACLSNNKHITIRSALSDVDEGMKKISRKYATR